MMTQERVLTPEQVTEMGKLFSPPYPATLTIGGTSGRPQTGGTSGRPQTGGTPGRPQTGGTSGRPQTGRTPGRIETEATACRTGSRRD